MKALTDTIRQTLNTPRTYTKLSLGLTALTLSTSVFATDARSLGMGGTNITSASGVNAAITNPALLMQQKRNQEKFNFHLSFSSEIQDNNEVISTALDMEDSSDLLEEEIRNFNNTSTVVNCDESGQSISPCVKNTGHIGDLANTTLKDLRTIGNSPIDFNAQLQLGFSLPSTKVPFALNITSTSSISINADFSEQDDALLQGLSDALVSGDKISVEDAEQNEHINYDLNAGTFDIDYTSDDLSSSAKGGAITRSQLSMSLAHTFRVNNHNVDIGITPKLSQIKAAGIESTINENDTISDQFDEDLVEESNVNFDLGALYSPPDRTELRFGAAIHNLLKETITTNNDYQFKTTPQLIASVSYDKESYLLTADIALNNAKTDNIESQRISLGSEMSWKFLDFRSGLSHDLAWDKNATSFSLGLGIGAFDIGMKYNGASSAELSMQVAFGF